MRKKGYIVLENGYIAEGELFAAEREAFAQIVFSTAMVDCLHTLTDPGYLGQMVAQTFPMIGNYGVIHDEFESEKPVLSAYILRELCDMPSNFRSEGGLEAWLCEAGIPGISGIDTRAIAKILRSQGVMNAALLHEKPTDMEALQKKLSALPYGPSIADVSCKQPHTQGSGSKQVVLVDYGVKRSLVEKFVQCGCSVTCVPHSTEAQAILGLKPDGIVLSNGPGNPNDNQAEISVIRQLKASGIPLLGICLGHQMLALSQGGSSEKLVYGHRGANQPVRDTKTGISYTSSQNHGYAVKALPANAAVSFININDGTCEGLEYLDSPAFSTQFIPGASGGAHDTEFIFDRFIDRMGGK